MPMTPVELIYGPITIGIFLNLLLFGIMITQTYFYITTFKDDRIWIKVFVGVVFVADTLNSFFDAAFLYKRLVHNFGDVDAVMTADWIFNTDPALTAIIALMVQGFFAWRIKSLTGSYILTGIVLFCSGVQFFSGLGTAVACSIVPHFVDFHKFQIVVILWLAFSALADMVIAIILTWHLRKQKTGFQFTDDLINRITRLTVQTGAITAIFAIIDLITFLVSTTSGLHLAFNMPLAKLYTNSLLSTLNSRSRGSGSQAAKFSSGLNSGIGRFARKEEIDLPQVQRHGSAYPEDDKESHELDQVDNGTKVYISVEETRDCV